MANARKGRDLTEGSIQAHIVRMAAPMSLGIVAMMLVGVVDAYWVGRLGTVQQAAVQFVTPVAMMVLSVSIGLGAGAVSVVSRAAGRGSQDRVRRVATDAVTLAFIAVGIVSVIGIILIDPIFIAMGASEAMMPFVREYMTIWFIGIVFVVGPMVASNILRALGDAIVPSLVMIIAAVINLILDPIMIFGWGIIPAMEVQGAALATLISNMIAFFIAFAVMIFRENLMDLSFPGWDEIFYNWREIARIGAPAAGSNTIGPFSSALVLATVARYGESAVAGFGVAIRIESFVIIPLFALSGTIGAIVGQNGGAGLDARVRETFMNSFQFCFIWSMAMALLLVVSGPWLAAAFLPSEEAQDVARLYWMIVPFSVVGYGIAMAGSAGFNGLGRPLIGVAMNVLRGLILIVPLALLGSAFGGMNGLIWGMFIANLVAGVLIVLYVRRTSALTAVDSR